MGCELVQPVPCRQKRLITGDIKHEEEAHGVPEECGGKTTKSLLARSVPQLQVDPLTSASLVCQVLSGSSPGYLLLPEVNAHSADKPKQQSNQNIQDGCPCLPRVEGVLSISVQEAGLSYARVTQSQELDEIVIVHAHSDLPELQKCHHNNHNLVEQPHMHNQYTACKLTDCTDGWMESWRSCYVTTCAFTLVKG